MGHNPGFSSDEDEYGGFLSDESDYSNNGERPVRVYDENVPREPTTEQQLNNLFFAVMNGNLTEVINVLDNGIDVNSKVRDDWSLIQLAASVGKSEIVHELISRGADVNSSRDKYTVLMAVCSCPESTAPASNCMDIINELIENGANVGAITRTRKTALMFAASNSNVDVVRKLLSCSDKNAVDNQGWNALFWAVNDGNIEVVQVLLDAGFNNKQIDVRGQTPINYAIQHDDESIIKLFQLDVDDTESPTSPIWYDFDVVLKDLLENQTPEFHRDVSYLLYGMKCEHLREKFLNISLLEFLTLNNEKLMEFGVSAEYERKRILTGLYKFHKYLYKRKTVPVIAKDNMYSTLDTFKTIVSAIRQLVVMEASLKYISCSTNGNTNINVSHLLITEVRSKIRKFRKSADALTILTKTWDGQNYPVDLITRNTKKSLPIWLKWFTYLSVLSVTIIVVKKV